MVNFQEACREEYAYIYGNCLSEDQLDITELPKKGHFVAQAKSIDTVSSLIGTKYHMFHGLNPLVRISFTNESDIVECMKMVGSIGMIDFIRKAHVELGHT